MGDIRVEEQGVAKLLLKLNPAKGCGSDLLLSIFFLSLMVSLKLEHYTRECEFRYFDKIKNKNKTKKKKTQKT